MATVKVKFRASSVGTGEGTLVYKVTHRRVTRQITTGYRLYPQEWDGAHSKVVIPSDRDSRRQAYLKALEEKIADDMTSFGKSSHCWTAQAGITRRTRWWDNTVSLRKPAASCILPGA